MKDTLIVIPARLGSTRFPGKVLADLQGKPVVRHCWEAAKAAQTDLAVATESGKVLEAVAAFGARAVLTSENCQSGTDRVQEAALLLEKERGRPYRIVVNLQGDEPFITSAALVSVIELLSRTPADIATAVTRLDPARAAEATVVKAEVASDGRCRAFYRAAPRAGASVFQHIGIYGYTREALTRFVALPPSDNERREKLEQLRAMDAGMALYAAVVAHVPIAIDTPEDLRQAAKFMKKSELNGSHHG